MSVKTVLFLFMNALILNLGDMRGKSHITRMPDYHYFFISPYVRPSKMWDECQESIAERKMHH